MQLSPGIRLRARPGDLDDWHDGLILGVTAADIADDFVQEAGDELTDSEDLLAKLRAASSASALAVNTFGPYRRHPERLVIGGLSGFSETQFEYPCPNGLSGTYPHFDFWRTARDGVLAVASKFLEPLDPETAEFSRQYEPPFLGTNAAVAVAEARWMAVFRALRDDPETYRYLDAAQLMKCYLGLKHSCPDRRRALRLPDLTLCLFSSISGLSTSNEDVPSQPVRSHAPLTTSHSIVISEICGFPQRIDQAGTTDGCRVGSCRAESWSGKRFFRRPWRC